jgi:thioredoxin reductase (NADPH)
LIENNISNDVTIIHRRSEFRANGENVLRMRTNKIKIYLDYEIKSIELNKINFISNLDQQTKIIPYDVILVQYGQTISRNNLNVFKNIDVNNVGRIKVQINQMTNLSNIYAIGDICIYEGKASSLICTHGETAVAIRDIINHIRQYDKK